ncbi:MAG: SLC13 family permease [Thermodesulfobacteriota bacterium]
MNISIDRRPLWLVFALKGFRPLFFLLLGLFFWYAISMPTPSGLSIEGHKIIVLFFIALALWVTNTIPLAITSIFVIMAIPLLGVMDTKETYALFGNEAIFFILGAFILSAAVMHSGLSSRIALTILERFGTTPRKLILTIFLLGTFLSFVMSEHAVAAMIFPIVLEIAKELDLKPRKTNYGKLLFLSLAWGCIIGGVATFLGGARVPLAVGILKETSGIGIGFFEYSLAVLPAVFIMLIIGFFILLKVYPIDIDSIERARTGLVAKNKALGNMGYEEYLIGILMGVTVFLWAFFGKDLGLANIALGAVVVLFIFRLVRWRDVEDYVNWGIILMYGGAITLGSALAGSGAAEWATNLMLGSSGLRPWAIIAILSLLTLFLTEGMSNSAVIAILMPIAGGIAMKFRLDPKIITYAIAMPAGLAFTLPMSTPANAIAVSSGYLSVFDMAKAGILVSLSAWIVFNLMVWVYWPMLGIR